MKRSIVLTVAASLSLTANLVAIRGSGAQALAQASASCPTVRILAIQPRDREQWLLLGSDKSLTMPVTVELTTEREIATYAVPLETSSEAIGGAIVYHSTPIVLANPVGTVLSASVRAQPDATATCENATRAVRTADDAGVYTLSPLSDDDARLNQFLAPENRVRGEPLGVKSRRSVASHCKVSHRDAKTARTVEPDYPLHARQMGYTGNVGSAMGGSVVKKVRR